MVFVHRGRIVLVAWVYFVWFFWGFFLVRMLRKAQNHDINETHSCGQRQVLIPRFLDCCMIVASEVFSKTLPSSPKQMLVSNTQQLASVGYIILSKRGQRELCHESSSPASYMYPDYKFNRICHKLCLLWFGKAFFASGSLFKKE